MKKPELYETLEADEMNKFLEQFNSNIELERLVEIKNKEEDFYGDFIVIGGYKFKFTYGSYQCLETPTEKHKPTKLHTKKAPNDHYPWRR